MMRFFLSARQAKELVDRATPIRLAIPMPPDEPRDLVAWARERIPDHARYVRRAEAYEVFCAPNRADGNLAGVIGQIEEWRDDQLRWIVPVVLVHLDPERPRHPPTKIAWPGRVEHD